MGDFIVEDGKGTKVREETSPDKAFIDLLFTNLPAIVAIQDVDLIGVYDDDVGARADFEPVANDVQDDLVDRLEAAWASDVRHASIVTTVSPKSRVSWIGRCPGPPVAKNSCCQIRMARGRMGNPSRTTPTSISTSRFAHRSTVRTACIPWPEGAAGAQ